MEGFGSLNPSADAAFLNTTGFPPSLWSIFAEDYQEFATYTMNHVVVDNNSQPEPINISPIESRMEEMSKIEDKMVYENKFIHPDPVHLISYNNLRSSFEMNDVNVQQEQNLRLPPKALVGHVFLPEENFPAQLQSSVESSNRFVSFSNTNLSASIEFEDDCMSSRFQNTERQISTMISSDKSLLAVNYDAGSYCSINSSASNRRDESMSPSSSLQVRKRNFPEEKNSSFDLAGENRLRFDALGAYSSTEQTAVLRLVKEKTPKQKKPRSENPEKSSNINFSNLNSSPILEPDAEALARVKEMIYRAAALRPISIQTDAIEKPKRKNVRISKDPQTAAARQRRERISDRIRILQRLVPGGTKMDIASMLDEAANYLKYLKSQVSALQSLEVTKNAKTMDCQRFPSSSS